MSRIISVFLDRDGTIIKDKHYLADPAGVELLPGALEGLSVLAKAGMRLFLVTNQSGIGRGYFSFEDYLHCNAAMERLLAPAHVTLEDGACCPHAPDVACACRKPATGMWEKLRDTHALRAATSAMIGDKRADIGFGLAAGFSATVLVLTGKGEAEAKAMGLPELLPQENFRALSSGSGLRPHAIARDLSGAAAWLASVHG